MDMQQGNDSIENKVWIVLPYIWFVFDILISPISVAV